MAVEIEIDVQVLKSEIKKTYASVSQEPEKDFIFPTGRPWAEDLRYPEELANVPETAVASFAGVANPWQLGRLAPGERVLVWGAEISLLPANRRLLAVRTEFWHPTAASEGASRPCVALAALHDGAACASDLAPVETAEESRAVRCRADGRSRHANPLLRVDRARCAPTLS
jgi:hypothetical protein